MGTIASILQLHAEEVRERVQQAMVQLSVNTSGKTAASIGVEYTSGGFNLIDTNGTFEFAEYGRGQSKNKNAKPASAMVYAIEQWLQYKGIQPDKGNTRTLAYAIATQINRNGTKRYQSGRPAGILQYALNDAYLTRLALTVTEQWAADILSHL